MACAKKRGCQFAVRGVYSPTQMNFIAVMSVILVSKVADLGGVAHLAD